MITQVPVGMGINFIEGCARDYSCLQTQALTNVTFGGSAVCFNSEELVGNGSHFPALNMVSVRLTIELLQLSRTPYWRRFKSSSVVSFGRSSSACDSRWGEQ